MGLDVMTCITAWVASTLYKWSSKEFGLDYSSENEDEAAQENVLYTGLHVP